MHKDWKLNRAYLSLSLLQVFVLISSLSAQILIARIIGPGIPLDSYFTVIGFSAAFLGAVASGGFYLIPGLILNTNQTAVEKSEIAGNALVAIIVLGLLVSIITVYIFLAFSTTSENLTVIKYETLLVILGWSISFFSLIATTWSAIGNSHGRAAVVIGSGLFPFAAIFVYMFGATSPTVVGLAGSQLCGIGVQVLSLGLAYRNYVSLANLNCQEINRVMSNLPISIVGAMCFSAYSAIDAILAPDIGSEILSHQALAQRLVVAFTAILVAGPFMLSPNLTAAMISDRRLGDAAKYVFRVGFVLTALCLGASVATPSIGRFMIALLFEGGEFRKDDTDAVVTNVVILLIGAGPMLFSSIIFRVFHNLMLYRQIASLSFAWVVLYGVIAKVSSPWLGGVSLSVAYAVSWWLLAAASTLFLSRYVVQAG